MSLLPFAPSRGISQGYPLFSYIFVLCMERLSRDIEENVGRGLWKPIRLGEEVHISHIFYADDVMLFGRPPRIMGRL